MSNYLKYIKLGIKTKEWFNYDGTPLPIRPLSSYEIDQIMETFVLEGITQSTFETIYKIKLKLAEDETVDISNKAKYIEYLHFFNEFDYWTVYHAMKDFQPNKFSQPDYEREFFDEFDDWVQDRPKGYYLVRKMKFVHNIAEDVRKMTNAPTDELVGLLRSNNGKLLASLVFRRHVPLVNEAWKLTPLQEYFMYYGDPSGPTLLKNESELPGIKAGTLKDVAAQLNKLAGIEL
ncbi:MAG: hypothetical protein GF364_11545 [Candidatus Lokiarchaeota archaeon]|nr:hypothetical protein [Candidatus Lokiarchaeota archaeon]